MQSLVLFENQRSTAYIVAKCPLLTQTSIIDLLIVYKGLDHETRAQGVVLEISFKNLEVQWECIPHLFRLWPTDLPLQIKTESNASSFIMMLQPFQSRTCFRHLTFIFVL